MLKVVPSCALCVMPPSGWPFVMPQSNWPHCCWLLCGSTTFLVCGSSNDCPLSGSEKGGPLYGSKKACSWRLHALCSKR